VDKKLLKTVYDRYGEPIKKPYVTYIVSGHGSATYQYVVTAFNETGETDGDLIVINNAPSVLNATWYITLMWDHINRAKGYRIYGRLAGYMGLLAEIDAFSIDSPKFIDYGVLVPDLTKGPPGENKTGRMNWDRLIFFPGRFAQSAEMNELQSVLNAKLKSIGDAVFSDGDIIRGCSLTVDKDTGEANVTEGLVYIEGAVRYVKGGKLILPTGVVYVGVNVVRSYVDEYDDPILRDPAQTYPGYATAGAAREVVDFDWVYSDNRNSVDVVVWKVVDRVPTLIKPVEGMTKVEKIIGRKLYDLCGNVLVYGYDTKIFKHNDRRDKVILDVSAGKAYVNGMEVEKPQTSFDVDIAQDESELLMEEVPVYSGKLYMPDVIPVASVEQVVVRKKVAETRSVSNVVDACGWYYDNTGVSLDSILGVWADSSKARSYTFSNSDPGCANRSTDVVLSGMGFALNPSKFSVGNTYYIEYLRYMTVTKGVRQKAFYEEEFIYQSGVSEYLLSKIDVIKNSRTPVVVVDSYTGNQYVEGVDYTIDLGRSDTAIGYAKIIWKRALSVGVKFKVRYYYWDHVVEGDYVSVDSYVQDLSSYVYDDIEYPNVIDFRASGVDPALEKPEILVQYKAYLSKWGWLMLKEDGEFEFSYGASATIPSKPTRPDGGLPLYLVYFPAASQDLLLSAESRYRVKKVYDINAISDRLSQLEYNVLLMDAELELLSKDTYMPKKGLLVDTFTNAEILDDKKSTVSIDGERGECSLRKTRQIGNLSIASLKNVKQCMSALMLPYSEVVFDQQLVWTENYGVEVNPYAVVSPYVSVILCPQNDFWMGSLEDGAVTVSTIDAQNPGWVVADINSAVMRMLSYDWSWQAGGNPFGNINASVAGTYVAIDCVDFAPYLRQRIVVVWIKNCLPNQDGIRGKFDGMDVALSVATQSDIYLAGLGGVVPRGSAGSSAGSVKADADGEVIAKFTIPDKVPAGEKVFEVYSQDGAVYGRAVYYGEGQVNHLLNIIYNPPSHPPRYADSIAQSFVVEKPVMLTSVWVWVYKVPPAGEEYGLEVGIRNMTEDGFPGQIVYGRGSISKAKVMEMMQIDDPSQTVTVPSLDNAVKVDFDKPIYLVPGYYCLYIGSQSSGYYLFTAKRGERVLGNLANPDWGKINQLLDRQVHSGVLFKSYNFLNWEVDMDRDLMFRLNKSQFDVSVEGQVEFAISGLNYPVHEFQFGMDVETPLGVSVRSEYDVGGGWTEFRMVDFDVERYRRRWDVVELGSDADILKVRLLLKTQDPDVSPIIEKDFGFIQAWTYSDSAVYYTKDVYVGQEFNTIRVWIDEFTNSGVVNYEVSFDSGGTWYSLPVVNSFVMRDRWVEKELGGSLSSITNNVTSGALRFIIRINLASNQSMKYLSPKLRSLRVLVY
jgi:hypothetical protein